MQDQGRQIIIGLIVLLVVIAGGYFFWMRTAPSVPSNATSTTTAATSTSSISTTTPAYTITQITDTGIPAPNFKAPLVFGADISTDVRAKLQSEAATVEARLSANALDTSSWIALATIRKMGGDYEGARVILEYIAQAAPKNPVAFYNLGDLYENFLHNYPKAEANFLTAITLKPDDTNPYRSLFELYTSFYKVGTGAAEAILKKGIAANPNSVDLKVILARYYKSLGRTTEAKAEYDAAIATANAQNQTSLAAQIQQEESSL